MLSTCNPRLTLARMGLRWGSRGCHERERAAIHSARSGPGDAGADVAEEHALPSHQPLFRHRGNGNRPGRAPRQHHGAISWRSDIVLASLRRQQRHAARRPDRHGGPQAPDYDAGKCQRLGAMNRGFYLTLMVGGFNASPVPQTVIDALTEVEVHTSVGVQGGFQLKFTWGKNSALAQLHASGFFDPRQRVIIAVTVNGSTDVLMDGVITKQDLAPSHQAGKSTLSITGLDLTAIMDFIDLTGIPYPAMPKFAIVALILAKYLPLGVVPVVIPTAIPDVQLPTEGYPQHRGTDYQFIQELGKKGKTGWLFQLIPGPKPGMSIAYWGPDFSRLFGGSQPALSINLDAITNIESISFSYDGTLATQYLLTILEDEIGFPIPVPIPNIDIFQTSLAARSPTPLKSEQIQLGEANFRFPEAAEWALKKLFETSNVVSGSGSLDVLRYGQVFKMQQICQVRGAGDFYDGEYYV